MASNSDSLYNILAYFKRHPNKVVKLQKRYNNVVRLYFADDYPVADAAMYFPHDRLESYRLTTDFVSENGELLDYYFTQAGHKLRGYHEVWATTAHLANQHVYLIDLSYE